MQPLSIHAVYKGRFRRVLLCTAFALSCIVGTRAASLQTFAVLFFQVTSDIVTIESSCDNSSTQKQVLARLSGEEPHSASEFQAGAPRVRYEGAQGLASFTCTEDVFAPGVTPLDATSGTFLQSDRDEIYGLFSAAGPGFEMKTGEFRIKLPRESRSN